MMRITLDAIDKRILNTVQQEGRITNQDLAERVGLSPSACLRRVQTLEGTGVIEGYSALVNPAALGFKTTVLVQITLERQTGDVLTKFEDAVRNHPRVMECNLMSGASDYLLRVVVRDAEDYEKLHKEVLSNLPGVARIQSNFALRTVVRRTSIFVA